MNILLSSSRWKVPQDQVMACAIIDPTKSITLIEYILDESNIEVNFKQYTATPKT